MIILLREFRNQQPYFTILKLVLLYYFIIFLQSCKSALDFILVL